MEVEENGKLILARFNKGDKSYIEFVKDAFYRWFNSNVDKFTHPCFVYNLRAAIGYDNISVVIDDENDRGVPILLSNPPIFDVVAAKLDELEFNEEKNMLEFIDKTVNLEFIGCINCSTISITNIISKFLHGVTKSTTSEHIKCYGPGADLIRVASMELVCRINIMFSDVNCTILLFDDIKITLRSNTKPHEVYNYEYNDISRTVNDMFTAHFDKYRTNYVENKIIETIIEDFNDILNRVEFSDFLKEVFKYKVFDHVRGGVGWLPKVKAAIKEE